MTGSASVADATDDVVDAEANTPDEPLPWIDIVRATVEGDGSELTVTFEMAADIPAEVEGAGYAYSFVITLSPTSGYELRASHTDMTGWAITVSTYGTGDSVTLEGEPVISGNTLTVTVPADLFADADTPFKWHAATDYLDMTEFDQWFDLAPDNAVPATFPQ